MSCAPAKGARRPPAPWASLVAAATPTPTAANLDHERRPTPRWPANLVHGPGPATGSPFHPGALFDERFHMLLIKNAAYFAAADFNWPASTNTMAPTTASVDINFFIRLKNRPLRCVSSAHAAHRQAVALLTGSLLQASGYFYIVRTNSQYDYCRLFEIKLI